MRSKQFSPLMRGSGPDWSSQFRWHEQPGDVHSCNESKSGGVMSHSRYVIHDKQLYRTVPKTFATNKGAMVLYTSEDMVLKDKVTHSVQYPSGASSLPTTPGQSSPKLDHFQRLILEYGANEEDKTCLKFTRPSTDDMYLDESTRPGALPEVYLEDLKYKTKCHTRNNRNNTPKLQATEQRPRHIRVGSAGTPQSAPQRCGIPEYPVYSRPPSAPPQPMKSVEKRKIEIIRDQLRHIHAADKRDRQKYADFEFVSSISENLKVKGLEGKPLKRRVHSCPVYRVTKFDETNKWVTEESQSLPLFVVTASCRLSPHHQQGYDSGTERQEEDYSDDECNNKLHYISSDIKHRNTTQHDITQEYLQDNTTNYDQYNDNEYLDTDKPDEDKVHINMDDLENVDKITRLLEERRHHSTNDSSMVEGTRDRADGDPQDPYFTPTEAGATMEGISPGGGSRQVVIDMSTERIESMAEMKVSCVTPDHKQRDDPQDETTTMRSDLEMSSILDTGSCTTQNNTSHVAYHSISSINSRTGEVSFNQNGKKQRHTTSDQQVESDSEFKEKAPPRSMVSIHRDNVDSAVSITKRKPRKIKRGKSEKGGIPWEKQTMKVDGTGSCTSYVDVEQAQDPTPLTLLNTGFTDDLSPPSSANQQARSTRKRVDRVTDDSSGVERENTSLHEIKPVIDSDVNTAIKQIQMEVEEDQEESRQRQEEREAELRKLEGLGRIVGLEDGSLKRLGQKVNIIQQETIQLKDKEAAQRAAEKNIELVKKEEERKAYEEIMRAQEKEYELHLQKLLLQEQERNEALLKKMQQEEEERHLKRKMALIRQNQNMELRQHVRLTKLKQKFSLPYRYSYFPLLKVNYMKIANQPETKKSKKASIKQY